MLCTTQFYCALAWVGPVKISLGNYEIFWAFLLISCARKNILGVLSDTNSSPAAVQAIDKKLLSFSTLVEEFKKMSQKQFFYIISENSSLLRIFLRAYKFLFYLCNIRNLNSVNHRVLFFWPTRPDRVDHFSGLHTSFTTSVTEQQCRWNSIHPQIHSFIHFCVWLALLRNLIQTNELLIPRSNYCNWIIFFLCSIVNCSTAVFHCSPFCSLPHPSNRNIK